MVAVDGVKWIAGPVWFTMDVISGQGGASIGAEARLASVKHVRAGSPYHVAFHNITSHSISRMIKITKIEV